MKSPRCALLKKVVDESTNHCLLTFCDRQRLDLYCVVTFGNMSTTSPHEVATFLRSVARQLDQAGRDYTAGAATR